MVFKFVLLAVLVAFANAGVLYSAPSPVFDRSLVNTEYNAFPQYSYAYGVHDAHTGDSKSQVESRNGDVVKGQYSLIDSDGTKRTVDYAADALNGFNAVVSKTPLVKPIVSAAPIVTPARVAPSPVVYSAPVVPSYAASPYVGYNYGPLRYSSGLFHNAVPTYGGYSNIYQGYVSPLVRYY